MLSFRWVLGDMTDPQPRTAVPGEKGSVHPSDGCVARALEDHPGGAEETGWNRVRMSPEPEVDSRRQCATEKKKECHAVVQMGARRYDR